MKAGAKKTVRKVAGKKAAAARKPPAKRPAAVSRDGAREQLDAVSKVMKALADPSVNVDRVADMIVKAVMRLADADSSAFMRRDPVGWVRAATQGMSDERKGVRVDPGPLTLWGRSALSGQLLHVADAKLAEPKLPDAEHRRTRLAVPVLRDRESIGVIFVSRDDPGGFDEPTIALIETFADQLAVAMENARLLKGTYESLERQTATAEVLRVISESVSDVTPVFETVLRLAVRLCEAEWGGVFRVDGELLRAAATHGASPKFDNLVRQGATKMDRGSLGGRVALEKRVVHIPDALADPEYKGRAGQRAGRFRTMLGVPVLRDGRLLAIINLLRNTVRPFTDQQIATVTSFADQAAIAIENVQLFNETKEALEQQTAISNILRVISRSSTEIQPVLDAIAENASRYCQAEDATLMLPDGPILRGVAHFGPVPSGSRIATGGYPIDGKSISGRAFIEGKVMHTPDILAEADQYPHGAAHMREVGGRAGLAVPLLREGSAIGIILLRRREPRAFTKKQIDLLRTFADQAAIAIENVRLFTETKEALERQTATAEVQKAISGTAFDLTRVLDTVIAHATRLTEAENGFVYQVDGDVLEMRASFGAQADVMREWQREHPIKTDHIGSATGRAFTERRTVHIPDVDADPTYTYADAKRLGGFRVLLAVPLISKDRSIGVIALWRTDLRAFSPQQITLVETFADQAVIAIENIRLFNETKEALERQSAIGQILDAINSSAFDLEPVLSTVAVNAMHLCDADNGSIVRFENGMAKVIASAGSERDREIFRGAYAGLPIPQDRSTITGRVLTSGRSEQVLDANSDPDFRPLVAPQTGDRSLLGVPLIRSGQTVGLIVLRRKRVEAFSPAQVSLVEAFAGQAVIAMENARLFGETKESLERQTALGEILQVIASSPTDRQPVLEAIVRNIVRFCSGEDAIVVLRVGERYSTAAHFGSIGVRPPDKLWDGDRGSVLVRAILDHRVVQSGDVLLDPEYIQSRALADELGYRAVLGVPLLRGGEAIGGIALRRATPGAFSQRDEELIRSFAAQAVIALENVRLFNETKEALERQTAIGDILRVISGSVTDIGPVLDAIASSAARFAMAEDASVLLVQGDSAVVSAHFGPLLMPPSVSLEPGWVAGRAILEVRTIQLEDATVAGDEYPHSRDAAIAGDHRAVLAAPLVRNGRPLGVIVLRRHDPRLFSVRQVELVQTFADQAAIAIENVRLFNETKEALDRQTAIADILKVISASPTDIQPVLDAIASSAARFASAEDASVMLVKDGELQPAAHHGPVAIPSSVRLDRGSVAARAVLDARTVHAADVTQGHEFPLSKEFSLRDGDNGQRAVLAAPLTRGTTAIGAIVLRRLQPRAFSDRQIELVQTFADQAVIALANTRLFKETQEALERQTATAELLAAMSQSAFDLKPVFEMVLEKSLTLCRAEYGWIRQTDRNGGGHIVASRRPDGAAMQLAPTMPIAEAASVMGRAYRERRSIHVHDVTADPTVANSKGMVTIGARTGLGVPLLRGDDVLGVLVLVRIEVHPFEPREIELVESFARQAAIAIENVRLFNEIQEKSAQLEVANRHKTEFLANMSHELRTPLNAVIGFSDVLLQRMFGELNDQQAEYLEDIRSSGTHLLTLINDILDLSKIEAGRMELELAPFSLVAALNNAVTLVRERAQSHGIKLELDVSPALDTVVADERKVKQVVVNLLANAVKFTPDGGTVRLRAERENGELRLAVHDTGIGIAREDQERIFEEFQQAGHRTEKSREGTGLGLALSKRMVELHGGTISVDSTLGKGSTFTVALPLKET